MKKSKYFIFILTIFLSVFLMGIECDPESSEEEISGLLYSYTSPIDESVIWSQNVHFEWSYIDFYVRSVDSMFLRIRPETSSVFTEIKMPLITESDVTYFQTEYDIDSLETSMKYYWNIWGYVELFDRSKDVSTFRTRSFTMGDYFLDPGDVHNPTPDSASVGVGLNPNFAWDIYNPDLISYDFNIYLGTTTDPPLLTSALGVPRYNLLDDTLEYHTHYYWQVEAYYDTDTIKGPLWEFTTDYMEEEDIFAMFEIDVIQSPSGYHTQEDFRARFDSGLALISPVKPLQADSVLFEDIKLDWISDSSHYSYFVMSEPVIQNGLANNIRVYGNSSVPNLNINVTFPACTLAVVSPESFEGVPITGFEVTWDGSECGGNVWLMLLDGNDSTGVSKEVVNDGLDSLTASDLAPLGGQTGSYDLYIVRQIEGNIDAVGYKPESLVRTRVINRMLQIDITSM